MNQEFEILIRSSQGYDFAQKSIQLMKEFSVWPTPLNFELWLHVATNPESDISAEVLSAVKNNEIFSDEIAENIAANYISRAKISDNLRDTGLKLTQELNTITQIINTAQVANRTYGETLAGANKDFNNSDPLKLKTIISQLTEATQKVITQNVSLETRLAQSANEVRSLKKHLDQVRQEAMTDALTNLANRKCFDENLQRLFETSPASVPLCLAVVDIDHFKNFNDTWGHQTGDQVIRYVASVLSRLGRPPRLAARYGGEEFALLFPGEVENSTRDLIEEARIEISTRILKRRSTNEDLGNITISIGIAQRLNGEDIAEFVERADSALYISKRNGRNQTTIAAKKLTTA